jgi:DNA-binding CsgD family transcriptional regulator
MHSSPVALPGLHARIPTHWPAVKHNTLSRQPASALTHHSHVHNQPPQFSDLHRLCLEIHSLPVHQMDAGLAHLLMRLGTLLNAQRVECALISRSPAGLQHTRVWRAWTQDGHPPNGPFDQTLAQTTPLTDQVHAQFFLRRAGASPEFDAQVHDWLTCALASLKRWLRWLALSHGISTAHEPLTTQQRKILLSLLAGLTEKQMANQLGLSVHTLHSGITGLYRHFGVRNRPSLTACWLGTN